MNKVELSELLASKINEIKNEKTYKSIISMHNNLVRFDYLNRVLIAIQLPDAFDLRTFEDWVQCDRDIIDNTKKVFITYPVNKAVYIDTETNEPVSDSDLNVNEIPYAIKYGIIRKEESVDTINIVSLYDIRNTYSKDKNNSKVDKQSLSSSKLLQAAQSILECSVKKSELTYYSPSQNTLFVGNDNYNKLAASITEILTDYFIEKYSDRIETLQQINGNVTKILKETLRYSIGTLFHIDVESDFNMLKTINVQEILCILDIDNSIISEIFEFVGYENVSLNIDATHSIIVARKASALLDLMEANEEYLRIRGK